MPEIVKPADIRDSRKYWGIAEVHLSSVQELLELAETLEIPVVLQESRNNYMFVYKNMKFIAKQ